MTKRIWLAMVLVVCAVLLCACAAQEPEHFQVINNVPTQVPVTRETQAPTAKPEPVDDGMDGYDPTSEEGKLDSIPGLENISAITVTNPPVTMAPTMSSIYAGASPVVIDPIDKPTATPVPPMSFSTYAAYDATKLGLSFQAPVGWIADDSASDAFTITNPDPSMAFQGYVTIQVQSVSGSYNNSQLTTQVKNLLSSVKSNYAGTKWSATKTASRTLLDAAGVYADYSVVLSGDVKVRGRVQVAYLNKKLYIVHMAAPAEYYETYKTGVYNKLRSTINITK